MSYSVEDLASIVHNYKVKAGKVCARCGDNKEPTSVEDSKPELRTIGSILTCWECEQKLVYEGAAIILSRRKHEKKREELLSQVAKLLADGGVVDKAAVPHTTIDHSIGDVRAEIRQHQDTQGLRQYHSN